MFLPDYIKNTEIRKHQNKYAPSPPPHSHLHPPPPSHPHYPDHNPSTQPPEYDSIRAKHQAKTTEGPALRLNSQIKMQMRVWRCKNDMATSLGSHWRVTIKGHIVHSKQHGAFSNNSVNPSSSAWLIILLHLACTCGNMRTILISPLTRCPETSNISFHF